MAKISNKFMAKWTYKSLLTSLIFRVFYLCRSSTHAQQPVPLFIYFLWTKVLELKLICFWAPHHFQARVAQSKLSLFFLPLALSLVSGSIFERTLQNRRRSHYIESIVSSIAFSRKHRAIWLLLRFLVFDRFSNLSLKLSLVRVSGDQHPSDLDSQIQLLAHTFCTELVLTTVQGTTLMVQAVINLSLRSDYFGVMHPSSGEHSYIQALRNGGENINDCVAESCITWSYECVCAWSFWYIQLPYCALYWSKIHSFLHT